MSESEKKLNKIYSKEEFIQKTGIEEKTLDAFLEAEMLQPAGKVDGSNPYFDSACLEVVTAATKLLDIGYSLEEVIRIRRKVGLPTSKAEPAESVRGPLLTVGELAKRVDTNSRTIKHWEEKGIIEPDTHSPGGFRLYREQYVEICILIQDLQNFGYTLDQIKTLADLARDFLVIRKDPMAFEPEMVMEKIESIREEAKTLNKKVSIVENGINRWRRRLKQHQKEMGGIEARIKKVEQHKKKKQDKDVPDHGSLEDLEPNPA